MDLSLLPIIADIVMHDLEEEFLKRYKSILFYKRYFDDYFIIISRKTLQLLLKCINSYYPRLNFTHEMENNSCINFSDVLVIKNEDCTVFIDLYKKVLLQI